MLNKVTSLTVTDYNNYEISIQYCIKVQAADAHCSVYC